MGRLLAIFIVVILGYMIFKSIKRRMDQPESKQLTRSNKKMLKCKHCNVHIPENEAIKHQNDVFCSIEHAKHYLE